MNGEANIQLSKPRALHQLFRGAPTKDGAGVNLVRLMGQGPLPMLDPFLLVDLFRSDQPEDYIAGFPDHPHRGFETVTYLLDGRMRHADSQGHQGVIARGGMQWMRAGRGVIHSEMPEQVSGLLSGIQVWVNLPAAEKMSRPAYRDVSAEHIPQETSEGVVLKVLAGRTSRGTEGALPELTARSISYFDLTLDAGARWREPFPRDWSVVLIGISGNVSIEGAKSGLLWADQLGVLNEGDGVQLKAESGSARALLLAGKPLREPVARGGPFVMNTDAEIRQAFADFRRGTLASAN